MEASFERAAIDVAVKLSINGATPIPSRPHLETAARVHRFSLPSGGFDGGITWEQLLRLMSAGLNKEHGFIQRIWTEKGHCSLTIQLLR